MASQQWWTEWSTQDIGDVFGPVYGGHTVQEAFYNTLQTWLPTYIAEFNRALGSEVLVIPFEYRHRPEYRTLPKNSSAAILVTVPGTAGQPEIFQNNVRAHFHVDVMVYIYGSTNWQETEALTQAYAACLRTCMVQNRSLGGIAETTIWLGEEYLEGEHSSTRTTGVSHIRFLVTIANVMNIYGGVPTPSVAAPAAVSVAETKNVIVTKESL
jgi:hypothetical protein